METCEQTKVIIRASTVEEVATLWLDFQRAVSKEDKLRVEFFQQIYSKVLSTGDPVEAHLVKGTKFSIALVKSLQSC